MLIYNLLQSVRRWATPAGDSPTTAYRGIRPDRQRIKELVDRSLMLVTALNPEDRLRQCSAHRQTAHEEGTTLKAAAISLGLLTAEQFDEWVRPEAHAGPLEKQ